jgi:hypothetical protein
MGKLIIGLMKIAFNVLLNPMEQCLYWEYMEKCFGNLFFGEQEPPLVNYLLILLPEQVNFKNSLLVAVNSATASSDIDGFKALIRKPFAKRSLNEKFQVFMYQIMQRLGFWGILLCASVRKELI